MLVATRQLLPEHLRDCALVGELALDGTVRPIKGALSMAMTARDQGFRRLLVPVENSREAAVVSEIAVFGVATLNDAVGLLSGHLQLDSVPSGMGEIETKLNQYDVDFSDVRGQEFAKRGAGRGRSRRSQCADDRKPGDRENDVGPPIADDSAALDIQRKFGNHSNLQCHGAAFGRRIAVDDPPVPFAPSHHLRCRYGGRREHPNSRRN